MKPRRIIITTLCCLAIIAAGTAYYLGYHHPKAVPGTALANGTYVALGDSVAAGVGLTPYSDASACDRTDASYPALTAKALSYTLNNYACSGASITAGLSGPLTVNGLAEPTQLSQLYAGPQPKLISITIGANDINWAGLIEDCITSVCNTDANTATVQQGIGQVRDRLGTILEQINQHYPTKTPRVVVTSYYNLFTSPETSCSDTTGIDTDEAAWLNEQFNVLSNATMNAVTGYAFARYVTPDLAGHELCSPNSWIQGLGEKAPYHPTVDGQKAFAQAVMRAAR